MDVVVIGAGIAGLSAAWRLKRENVRVMVFERNYKPGGRMNTRRKAGLIVDHGNRFLMRSSPVLRELIVDCGLHGEAKTIEKQIYTMRADGSFVESASEALKSDRLVFPDGMLALPEALRRTIGGFYSIRVTGVEYDESTGKFQLHTEPPMRPQETMADAVIVACPAPVAWQLTQPVHGLLHEPFVNRLKGVEYNRCIALIAALPKVELPIPYYGLIPQAEDNMLNWLAFEDAKCASRAVQGWSSLVAHASPGASNKLWEQNEAHSLMVLYAEARKLVPQLPAMWRWARTKRWEYARVRNLDGVVNAEEFPCAPGDLRIEFCGDWRVGDGAEDAARSGKEAAERLIAKM